MYTPIMHVLMVLNLMTVAFITEAVAQDKDTEQRVRDVLAILGDHGAGQERQRCAGCHAMSVLTFYRWSEASIAIENCLDLKDEAAQSAAPAKKWRCIEKIKGGHASFSYEHLGIFAADPDLETLAALARAALAPADAEAVIKSLKRNAAMPPAGEFKLSADEFAKVRSWFSDKMPQLEEVVGGVEGAPTTCTPSRTDELASYLETRELQSWRTQHLEQGLKMFACPNGNTGPQLCFKDMDATGKAYFPPRSDLTNPLDSELQGVVFRDLYDITFGINFWMRVSPDGRFVGNGMKDPTEPEEEDRQEPTPESAEKAPLRARISDLQAVYDSPDRLRDILIGGYYDPAFFPDNSGFIIQGIRTTAVFCPQGLIEDPATMQVTFLEPRCSRSDKVTLYQSVGAALDGDDFWTVAGTYHSDSGRGDVNEANIEWGSRSELHLNQFQFDGSQYVIGPRRAIWTPFVGDWVSSPSSGLIMGRLGGMRASGKFGQLGYRLYLTEDLNTVNSFADLTPVAEICSPGGKGQFSFDERYLATFHYVVADDFADFGFSSASDPEFKAMLDKPTANLFLFDLLTGKTRRLTKVAAGQRAMFPSFRADGWLYFLLTDADAGTKKIVATDAVIAARK